LERILALEDFEDAARRILPRPIFGYASGGVETNASMRANRAVWDELAFVPRMLVDTAERTQQATLFGRSYDAPFGIAPMGGSSACLRARCSRTASRTSRTWARACRSSRAAASAMPAGATSSRGATWTTSGACGAAGWW